MSAGCGWSRGAAGRRPGDAHSRCHLPGRFGARIEDIVTATDDGGRRLNRIVG